ncbi:MAG TPA: PIN domain-containing protein [Candidatus Obscuribacterales bacterium]
MTALYLLDTDICSYIMKRSHAKVLQRLVSVDIESVAISVITEAELLFGLKLSANEKQNQDSLDAFIKHVSVIEWSRSAAEHYADICAYLTKRGQLIGANDLLIAAQARSLGACLVTNNEREFSRVQDLSIENWAS